MRFLEGMCTYEYARSLDSQTRGVAVWHSLVTLGRGAVPLRRRSLGIYTVSGTGRSCIIWVASVPLSRCVL